MSLIKLKTTKLLFAIMLAGVSAAANAQSRADDSGISAGFFDSSEEQDLYFSTFKLPPLAVLFENAKQNPTILSLAKAQELAQAEVTKQKKHIFSYVYGHASYSYGKTDMWSNGSDTYSPLFQQFQGHEQSYWNVGVNLNIPLEDVLDLGASVRRRRIEVEQAQMQKDIAYDNLKLQIATLYVQITNDLMALKTAGENAAIYQGAEALNERQFHHGNFEIEDYAYTGLRGQGAVNTYQGLLTQITINILTLEILTHTPIITNTTTDITLDDEVSSARQIQRDNRAMDRQIQRDIEEQRRRDAQDARQRQRDARQNGNQQQQGQQQDQQPQVQQQPTQPATGNNN
jgi:hypothetical protein